MHDAQRLEDGKDLNDALMDFFVKLGQSLIPEGGGAPPVAYLGSHFYDVLRKGGAKDGRIGHKNVAGWARRKLGQGGLFGESVGALAVPINEVLKESYDGTRDSAERHWWLAILLNPRAVGAADTAEKDVSCLCLDSFVRAETKFDPPIRATKAGGSLKGYPVEVSSLSRVGFCVNVNFRAWGDGSAGALTEPRKSRLKAGGREFANRELNARTKDLGGDNQPSNVVGSLGFRLDRRGAAKTGGEYVLDYGDVGDNYHPPLKLRMGQKPTPFQAEVGRFLGGYLEKEQVSILNGKPRPQPQDGATQVEQAICLPGIPQQETSHDCGFFILEAILRIMQLSSEALRELAQASSVEIAMLPWPSQKQVLRRKAKMREIMASLFAEARKTGNSDVESLLKGDPGLRARVRAGLKEGGSSFEKGYERWAAGDWDLSPSPSRSQSREPAPKPSRSRSQADSRSMSSRREKKKKKKRRRCSSSRSESPGRKSRRSRSPSNSKEVLIALNAAQVAALSVTQLRSFCVKHGVLPEGIVEKADLVQALASCIVQVPQNQVPKTTATPTVFAPGAAAPPTTSKFDVRKSKFDVRETKVLGLNVDVPAAKAPPAPAGKSFTRAAIEAMPSKELRALCLQHKVLPPGSVERSELLQALAPLASG